MTITNDRLSEIMNLIDAEAERIRDAVRTDDPDENLNLYDAIRALAEYDDDATSDAVNRYYNTYTSPGDDNGPEIHNEAMAAVLKDGSVLWFTRLNGTPMTLIFSADKATHLVCTP